MKTGISFSPYGNGIGRFGEAKFLKLKECGFSAADYGMMGTESEIYTLSETELRQKMLLEKTAAAEAGIEISQVHGPWRYPPQDATPELRAERMEKMKRSILATRMLGCRYWVVHPIMPYGIKDLDEGKARETWDLNTEFMTGLLEYAKDQDVVICLENMPMRHFSIATPKQILKFVQTINDDHFKICLDTGHVAVFPGLSVGDAVRELGDYIKVLHVHDNMGEGDQHLWPTKGIIDWYDFIKALKETDFSGVLSCETGPSEKLDDELFESGCRELCNIARQIAEKF